MVTLLAKGLSSPAVLNAAVRDPVGKRTRDQAERLDPFRPRGPDARDAGVLQESVAGGGAFADWDASRLRDAMGGWSG